MRKLDNKFKHILPVILLLLLITIIIGVTYATYTLTTTGNENSITTGLVSMSYTESTNVIDIKNALPMSDAEGKTQSNYFDFSVTSNLTLGENDQNTPVYYSIELEPLSVDSGYNALQNNQIKIYLEDITNNKALINSKLISNLDNYTLYSTSHTHKYNTNSITTNYRLRTWIDYDVDASNWSSLNKYEYKFRVNVNGDINYIKKDTSSYGIISNQVQTMNISYKYKNGANIIENGITYNNNDNGVFLFNGTDDNGGDKAIYYYRGNVNNNNVLFANMCWKIVRTTSTGGTKLIYNGVPSDDGKCNNTGTASQLSSTRAFNTNYNSPADVGYMYGTRYTYTQKNMSSVTDTYKYGNDVTYSNGTYTLTGKTMNSTSWSTDSTTLADGYHYTCLNSTGTCTEVYYITYFGDSSYMYYLTFTGGDTLESAKTKMFTNTTDSTIKTYIDNWYADNLIDYSEFLENTIFCNDRSFASGTNGGSLSSKDTNSTSYSDFKSYENMRNGTPSLECTNINDRFSLKVESGGTNGYGNNALTYPVGLLTLDEAELAGGQIFNNSNYYLYIRKDYWLLSPARVDSDVSRACGVYLDGDLGSTMTKYLAGVRPSISLASGTEFEEGTDGTVNNPYVVVIK